MSNEATCNGWTNYATWKINLELADDLCASMVGEQTFAYAYQLAEYLQATCGDYVRGEDYDEKTLATQYALDFLDQVNWQEIAEHNEELLDPEKDGEDAA